MLTPVKHIAPLVNFTVKRVLPVEGTVLVRVGQDVSPADVVAQTILKPRYRMIDAAGSLGIQNKELKKYLKRKVGEKISKNGILAEKEGIVVREIRAPENCRLVAVSSGQLLLELEVAPTKVLSGVRGTVKTIETGFGAVIETTGACIEGIWGNDKTGFGVLSVVAKSKNHKFAIDDLDVNMRGSILFAGHCGDAKALEFAEEIGIRGIIFGSMSSMLIPVAEKLSFPIVVLDGFGSIEMDPMIFNIITTNKEREVTLIGDKQNRYLGVRPLITIPLPTTMDAEELILLHRMRKGSRVRVTNGIKQGRIGEIVGFVDHLQNYPSGVKAKSARVRIDEMDLILPIGNLEIIE